MRPRTFALSVVLLEDGELGSGMTELTTAYLANVLDDPFARSDYLHGTLSALAHATSNEMAMEEPAIELPKTATKRNGKSHAIGQHDSGTQP